MECQPSRTAELAATKPDYASLSRAQLPTATTTLHVSGTGCVQVRAFQAAANAETDRVAHLVRLVDLG